MYISKEKNKGLMSVLRACKIIRGKREVEGNSKEEFIMIRKRARSLAFKELNDHDEKHLAMN